MSYANTTTYGNITINVPPALASSIGAGTSFNLTAAMGSGTLVGGPVPSTQWAASQGSYSYSNEITVGKTRVTDDDIMFGNVSLKATLKKFEERLAILVPNPAVEAEFEELKQVREKYIELEKKLSEQKAAWDVLKK